MPRGITTDYTCGKLHKSIFQPAPHQQKVLDYFPTSPYKGLLLYHKLGSGKCHGKDTEILLHNGKIKKVQDIKIGEQIMGDDSLPRNILSICKGKEQMYSINSNKGYSFKCNESHILSLKILNNRTLFLLCNINI